MKKLGNRQILFVAASALAAVFFQEPVQAQAPAPAASAVGVVTKIDADARQIVLKTDAGAEIAVAVQPKAGFRKVAPGGNRSEECADHRNHGRHDGRSRSGSGQGFGR